MLSVKLGRVAKELPNYHFSQDFLLALNPYFATRQVIFLIDQACWNQSLERRLTAVQQGLVNSTTIILPGGEAMKTWGAVEDLVQKLWRAELDRTSLLVVVGGGAMLDMVGFVASCYMRGVDYCLVPSTLLAQVDAAIGGKTAINLGNYKNLFGTFANPLAIVWDYSLLKSLPDKHFRGAMAEIIKHSAIKSPTLWKQLEQLSVDKLRNCPELLSQIIQQNVQIKTQIISQDFREQGERKILNFGHSLAHALEQTYNLQHSEAVSIGMYYACHWSVSLLKSSSELPQQMALMLENYQLPTQFSFDWSQILGLLKMDKKRIGQQLQLVLLTKIGSAEIYQIPLSELPRLSNL